MREARSWPSRPSCSTRRGMDDKHDACNERDPARDDRNAAASASPIFMSEERRQPSGLLQHGGGEWRFVTEVRRRATKGFEVRHVPGKGQGVFAMRDFAIGEDLLTELPLLSWPNDITMTDKNIESVVEAELVRAGPRTRTGRGRPDQWAGMSPATSRSATKPSCTRRPALYRGAPRSPRRR